MIAGSNSGTRLRQRRIDVAIPRIAAIDPFDAPAVRLFVEDVICAEKSAPVLRRATQVAANFVRMGRAELAVHLPNKIGELAASPNAWKKRRVAIAHANPVDPRHILDP